jgi:hypothetical protein
MKAAIETSKHVYIKMLQILWADGDPERLGSMLHGFCMLTNMDYDEPDAHEEMQFLRRICDAKQEIIDMEEK